MTDPQNYGFLTSDGVVFETNLPQLFHANAIERQPKTDLVIGKQNSGSIIFSNLDSINDQQNLKHSKTPWWRSLFGKKKHGENPKRLRQHKSVENLGPEKNKKTKSSKVNRERKCMSVVETRRLKNLDEVDATSQAKPVSESSSFDTESENHNDFVANRKNTEKQEKLDSQHNRNTDRSSNKNQFKDLRQLPIDSLTRLPTVDEESKQNIDFNNRSNKPMKPPRKHLSLKSSNAPAPNIQQTTNKSKVKRSKSLLSLRNPFSRSKHTKCKNSLKTSSSADNLLDDLEHKIEKMDIEKNFLNIYEKYPRRNQEQPKFLVHIQTKEAMPIKDGVPQWDAQSYQYVTQRSRSRDDILQPRPQSAICLGCPQSGLKVVESSFIGPSSATVDDGDNESNIVETKPLKPASVQPRCDNAEVKKPTAARHHVVEAVVHTENKRTTDQNVRNDIQRTSPIENSQTFQHTSTPITKPETSPNATLRDKLQQKSPHSLQRTRGFLAGAKVSRGVHLRSASIDDKLFGCSFVLTGSSEELQTPNVLSKHPYLAQSTPLRHMAKCLRQASQSDMPKKLSPVRVSPSYEFPPPPASWTKLSREESNEANNHTAGELKTSLNNISFNSSLTPEKDKRIKTIGFCQRRCHSDSDLSSFYLTPMKLNEKYDVTDKSIDNDLSRNTKTELFLHRMKNRIERLEKLIDSNSADRSVERSKKNSENLPSKSTNVDQSSSKRTSALSNKTTAPRNVGVVNSAKRSSLLRSSEKAETSMKQFKKLIHQQMQKGKVKAATLHVSKRGNRQTIVGHERMFSEPIYDYLWPKNDNEIGPESRSELSPASPLNSTSTYPSSQTENKLNQTYCSQLSSTSEIIRPLSFTTCDIPTSSSSFNGQRKVGASFATSLRSDVTTSQQYLSDSFSTNGYEGKDDERNFEMSRDRFDGNKIIGENNDATKLCSIASEKIENENFKKYPFTFKSNQQNKIRLTMLEEMQRISTKYSAHASQTKNTKSPRKIEDWKNELRFYMEDGFLENSIASDSDSASQQTLLRGDSDTSSGDTLVNDFATTDSRSNWDLEKSAASETSNMSSYYRHDTKEHVVEYDINDARNFMDWDCDETDL